MSETGAPFMVSLAHRRLSALTLAIVTAMVVSACSNSDSSTTPTTPSTPPTTEVFSGSVPVGGTDSHTFSVALSGGQVNIILTAAGPPATIFEGLGIGMPGAANTCPLLNGGAVVTPAGPTAQLSGTAAAGSYCVVVYDVGNQTSDITYSVTVSHY